MTSTSRGGTMTDLDLINELHKTILNGAADLIQYTNPAIQRNVAEAFVQGYLYNAGFEILQKTFPMDISDAFFTIYSRFGQVCDHPTICFGH